MNFLLQKIFNKFIYRPLIKLKLKKVGKNFRLGFYSEILNPQYFEFGDHFYCGPFAIFGTNINNPVKIGDYVMFGPRCIIQGGNHEISYQGFLYNGPTSSKLGKVIIENGVWVGCDTTIISGTDIGEGSVIGAKSLVNKKIPPYVVAAGVPTRVIKPRYKTKQELSNALESCKSMYSLNEIINSHQELGFNYL